MSVPQSNHTEPPTSGGESVSGPQGVVLPSVTDVLAAIEADPRYHCACPNCYRVGILGESGLGPGAVYVATCGALTRVKAGEADPVTDRPINACPDCVTFIETPGASCPVCGYVPGGEAIVEVTG